MREPRRCYNLVKGESLGHEYTSRYETANIHLAKTNCFTTHIYISIDKNVLGIIWVALLPILIWLIINGKNILDVISIKKKAEYCVVLK